MRTRHLMIAVLLVSLGTLLGPVAIAAWSAAMRANDPLSEWERADELLREHDARHEEMWMSLRLMDMDIQNCGYRREQLFGSGDDISHFREKGDRWTPYAGYFDLTLWRDHEYERTADIARGKILREKLSGYSVAFLKECIRATSLSSLCDRHVHNWLAEHGAEHPHSAPLGTGGDYRRKRGSKTICVYLDGLAVRNSQSLPRRDSSENQDPPNSPATPTWLEAPAR